MIFFKNQFEKWETAPVISNMGTNYTVYDFEMDRGLLVDRHEKSERCRDNDFPAIHNINNCIQEPLGYN